MEGFLLSTSELKKRIPIILPRVFCNDLIECPDISEIYSDSKKMEENKYLYVLTSFFGAYFRKKPESYWEDLENFIRERRINDLTKIARYISRRIFKEFDKNGYSISNVEELRAALGSLSQKNEKHKRSLGNAGNSKLVFEAEPQKFSKENTKELINEQNAKDPRTKKYNSDYGYKNQQKLKNAEKKTKKNAKEEKIEDDSKRAVEMGLEYWSKHRGDLYGQ